MKIYDISTTLSEETLIWPNDPPFSRSVAKSVDKGNNSNVSVVTMGTHFGTHVDPPRHIYLDGRGVDALPLDALVGPAVVVDAGDAGMIEEDLVQSIPASERRILFRTANTLRLEAEPRAFFKDFVALTEGAARLLAERKALLVGIDYLSIEAAGMKTHPVHRVLMDAGTVIVEGLALAAVPAGRYTVVCAPLKLKDGDGAPSRVFLLDTVV
ncbi:MAG TPA: cyclase family protein [bacterium]|nr:cyclase family protein [bacterium]